MNFKQDSMEDFEPISALIEFQKTPDFLTADLDNIFRKIALICD